jgi:hypothetical protein
MGTGTPVDGGPPVDTDDGSRRDDTVPATVQGMPEEVEEHLDRRIRSFLWADKSQATINKETVHTQSDVGGKNLLDLIARNEAITVT